VHGKPSIFAIMLTIGADTRPFRDYAAELAAAVTPARPDSPLKAAIIAEAGRLLPEVDLAALDRQLTEFPLVSTADHHGLLSYSLLYNANILLGEVGRARGASFVVVLSGDVMLNNVSNPKGLHFGGQGYHFFSRSRTDRLSPWLLDDHVRERGGPTVLSALVNLRPDALPAGEKECLRYLLSDILSSAPPPSQPHPHPYGAFSDQVSRLNQRLWTCFFDREMRREAPTLVYLNKVPIVRRLVQLALGDPHHWLRHVLLDPAQLAVLVRAFSGIPSCWGDDSGSHLFWGIRRNGDKTRMVPLRLSVPDRALLGEGLAFPLDEDALVEAIEAGQLYPGAFLDYALCALGLSRSHCCAAHGELWNAEYGILAFSIGRGHVG
jgi:hypothetical protein